MGILRTSEFFRDSTLRLIAVEAVDIRQSKTCTGGRFYGNIEPVAVVVCNRDKIYALDMEAEPANLDKLRRDIPELEEIITASGRASS